MAASLTYTILDIQPREGGRAVFLVRFSSSDYPEPLEESEQVFPIAAAELDIHKVLVRRAQQLYEGKQLPLLATLEKGVVVDATKSNVISVVE